MKKVTGIEFRKDEGVRLFNDGCIGTLRTTNNCGDKAIAILNEHGGGDMIVKAITETRTDKAKEIRRLTEIECERLQGFKDNHTMYGNYDGQVKKISKTQRYKMCGNAVTVDIVEMIAKKLYSSL